jgi:NADH dehydrogenase/NADH:ubiquinone oxidoreductase subunit G
MAKTVKLTIDGREVQVPEGTNLIEAAEAAGIHIPNLCYLKGMRGIGACRLCLVEVEGKKAPMIACNLKAQDGMVVRTQTDALREARKFVIDLILSMHPLDCMTCTKAGVCTLQDYAYQFELKESTFSRKKFGFPTDEANPFIKRDPDYCILCARCVRVCKEQGTNVLDFYGRGVGARVVTAQDRPLQEAGCTFCGSCVDACPVNALLEADRWRKGREWEYRRTDSHCLLCGNACAIRISTLDEQVARINAGGKEGSVSHYICAYGRFGYDALQAHTRLTSPMKRLQGRLQETTWEDALSTVAQALRSAGPEAGILTNCALSNEEALAVKEFARALGTDNLASTMGLYAERDDLLLSRPAELDQADVLVLVGLAPSQWQRVLPALDAAIRKRLARGGKLLVINSSEERIAQAATVALTGDEPGLLKALIKALAELEVKMPPEILKAVADAQVSQDVKEAAELLKAARQPVVLSAPALFGPSANLAMALGAPAAAVPLEANALGAAWAGIDGARYEELSKGQGLKALLVVGQVPLSDRPQVGFLAVACTHKGPLTEAADVLLPIQAPWESTGSIVHYLKGLVRLNQAVRPPQGVKTLLQGLGLLSKELDIKFKAPTEAEFKKLLKEAPELALQPFEKKSQGARAEELLQGLLGPVIEGSRLQWLREAQGTAA